jgi:hypothetical protein
MSALAHKPTFRSAIHVRFYSESGLARLFIPGPLFAILLLRSEALASNYRNSAGPFAIYSASFLTIGVSK